MSRENIIEELSRVIKNTRILSGKFFRPSYHLWPFLRNFRRNVRIYEGKMLSKNRVNRVVFGYEWWIQ